MKDKYIKYFFAPIFLLFPSIIFISYLNNDFDLKYIYVLSFFCLLLFILAFSLNENILLFISENFVIVLLILTFAHTFLWFTIFPIIFNFEYNYLVITAFLFILMILYISIKPINIGLKYSLNKMDKILMVLILFSISFSVLVINYKEFTTTAGFSKNIIQFSSLYFFYYLLPVFLLNAKKRLDYFVIAIYLLGFISSVIGIYSVFIKSFNPVNEYPGTSVSFFTHPNANAFLYSYTIPCAFYLLINFKDKFKILTKIGVLLSILITLFNQILTFSRSGIIAVFVGILIIIFYYYKKVFWVLLVLIPIFIYVLFNITTSEKGASTVVGRAGLIATGVEMIINNKTAMLWGYGVENNFKQFEETKNSLLFLETNNNPHNSILFLILAFGVVPTFFILMFILKRLIILLVDFFRGKLNNVSVLSFSIIVSVIFQSLFEDYVMFPQYYMYHLFLIFIGLLFLTNFEYKSTQLIQY